MFDQTKKMFRLLIFCTLGGALFLASLQAQAIPDWRELKRLDSFHPPVAGLRKSLDYKEWHYFNMLSEEQDVAVSVIMILEGDVSDPQKSYAIDTIAYSTPEKSQLLLDVHSTANARWSKHSPNLEIAKSFVEFYGGFYRVYSESADGSVVFNAVYIPAIANDGVYQVPVGDDGHMNWFLSSPSMHVIGNLTIDKGTREEKTFHLINEKGYHDHNWGYWDWADSMGWDWGQASQMPQRSVCRRGDSDCGAYSLSFFNYTDSNDTQSRQSVIRIWDGQEKIATFEQQETSFTNAVMHTLPCLPHNSFPKENLMQVQNESQSASIRFQTKTFSPMFLPSAAGFRIIWELTGTFSVEGEVDGKDLEFETDGVMEYFGSPMLIEQGSEENMAAILQCIAEHDARF